jgi:phosphate transport system substrate-binding protein
MKILLKTLFFLLLLHCKKESPKTKNENNPTFVTVDQNLKPVMDEMMEVFSYNHPKHKISIEYKPHKICKQDLLNPKVDLVIGYHLLNKKEKQKWHTQNKFYPETQVLAFDAMLVFSNTKTPIYRLNKTEIGNLLLKKTNKNHTICLDGQTENSTYDYLSQNFLNGKSFHKNVEGAKNPTQLVEYVQNNPNKIGFTNNLVLNNASLKTEHLVFASIENKNKQFIYPSKENILANQYPLIRPISFILKHNYETPATWLVSFMQQEKGQLIFKRNGVLPANINLSVRKIRVGFAEKK